MTVPRCSPPTPLRSTRPASALTNPYDVAEDGARRRVTAARIGLVVAICAAGAGLGVATATLASAATLGGDSSGEDMTDMLTDSQSLGSTGSGVSAISSDAVVPPLGGLDAISTALGLPSSGGGKQGTGTTPSPAITTAATTSSSSDAGVPRLGGLAAVSEALNPSGSGKASSAVPSSDGKKQGDGTGTTAATTTSPGAVVAQMSGLGTVSKALSSSGTGKASSVVASSNGKKQGTGTTPSPAISSTSGDAVVPPLGGLEALFPTRSPSDDGTTLGTPAGEEPDQGTIAALPGSSTGTGLVTGTGTTPSPALGSGVGRAFRMSPGEESELTGNGSLLTVQPRSSPATSGDDANPLALDDTIVKFFDGACWSDPKCRPQVSATPDKVALAAMRAPVTLPENVYFFGQPYTDRATGLLIRPTPTEVLTRIATRFGPQTIGAAAETNLLSLPNVKIDGKPGKVFAHNPVGNELVNLALSSGTTAGLNKMWQKADPLLGVIAEANPSSPILSKLGRGRLSSGLKTPTLAALPWTIRGSGLAADATTNALNCNPSKTDTNNLRYWCKYGLVDPLSFAVLGVGAPVLLDDLASGRQINAWSATPAAGAYVEKFVSDVGFGPEPPHPDQLSNTVRGGVAAAGKAIAGIKNYADWVSDPDTKLDSRDLAGGDLTRIAAATTAFLKGAPEFVGGLTSSMQLGSGSRGYPQGDLWGSTTSVMNPDQQARYNEAEKRLETALVSLVNPNTGQVAGLIGDGLNNLPSPSAMSW